MKFVGLVHERLVPEDGESPRIGILKNHISHTSTQTLDEWFRKAKKYVALEPPVKKHLGLLEYLIRPTYRFVNIYIINLGFLDGVKGLVYAFLSGLYEWKRLDKDRGIVWK